MTGINSLILRDDVTDEIPSELPDQGGGQSLPVLLPGISVFRIPANVIQCVEAYDEELKDANKTVILYPPGSTMLVNGAPVDISGRPKVVQRLRMKFDKEIPLVVVGGPNDGHPVATSISNQPRNRARKDAAPSLVSDLTYLVRISLGEKAWPLSKPSECLNAIKMMAGKTFRAEHGLTANCRPTEVRYINDPADTTGRGSIKDPSGQLGCGKRIYTQGFKLPDGSQQAFSDIVYCPKCTYAKLRGFFQIEQFLPPTPGQ